VCAFTFHRITGPGLMDQQMEIVNYDSVAVVPRLRYTPVDSAGAPLDGVVATAAYGSNEGKMMVPARQSSFDVLAFTGRDVAKVAGVQVGIESLTMDLGFPAGAQLAQPQALDGEGQPTSKSGPFSAVKLTNPNAAPVTEGVVCIEWSQPLPGQPQQARAMVTLGYVTIDAHASATLRPPASTSAVLRTGCGSLKSFFAPDYLAG
jgi:hypothetical protein